MAELTRAIVILLLLAAPASAQLPPFAVILPDGREVQACSARYLPDAKTFVFSPCIEVFRNGFE